MDFTCGNGDREQASFEMIVLPLVHTGQKVSRMLGSVGAHNRPYWLGSIELGRLKLASFDLVWPGRQPAQPIALVEPSAPAERPTPSTPGERPNLRVLEGGLSTRSD